MDLIARELGISPLEVRRRNLLRRGDRLPCGQILTEEPGASLVLEGIPDFTHLPPSSRLQGPDGVTLVVDMENLPCQEPAVTIEKARPGLGKGFKPAAEGKRGVTAWVEREGTLRLGDEMRLFVPAQRGWQPGVADGINAAE
mgnify:CR=1 FL=1